jgi:hypothetical protein
VTQQKQYQGSGIKDPVLIDEERDGEQQELRHRTCGTALTWVLGSLTTGAPGGPWCPTCRMRVDSDEMMPMPRGAVCVRL